MRPLSCRTLLLCSLLALLAGCTTTQVAPVATPAHPGIAAAATLASQYARLDTEARQQSLAEIERLLAELDDDSLTRETAALPADSPLYVFAGTVLQQRGLPLPRPFDPRVLWALKTGNRAPAEFDGYRPPRKLAVLLPLSGNLATAAAPVRDGLLAGYYAERRTRPEIQFYDTTSGATGAYSRAVADGADFIVGPLVREEVTAIVANQSVLSVPVLALNRPNEGEPPSNNFSFALAPEDDGIAAADLVLSSNAGRVLVLHGGDDNANRSIDAFTAQLLRGGGQVVRTIRISGDGQADIGAVLGEALLGDGGVDAVFLALRNPQARAIAPQLAATGYNARLRVGISQLATSGRPEENAVLDGILFPTERWTATGVAGLPSAASAAGTLPTARGGAARLFAFGHDAWMLTAFMERLVNGREGSLRGATGDLRLDDVGNVLRTPIWATFRGGQVIPVGEG